MTSESAPAGEQARRLAFMKRVALGLLVAAALLYAVATLADGRPGAAGWWGAAGYVAAFAEAAMVGAIADWFAVVALFRRPLGLPIPHTAIIPSNKDRIGANLADFICNNFLSTPQVLAKVRQFDLATRMADWLAQPANAARLGEHAVAAARFGLVAFDDQRVRAFLGRAVAAGLSQIDLSRLAGQMLDALTAGGRHQALLDDVLRQVAALVEGEEVQERITEAIAREVKGLRFVGLDQVAARLATRKIVAAVARTVREIAARPAMAGDPDAAARSSGLVSPLDEWPAVPADSSEDTASGEADPGRAPATSEAGAEDGAEPPPGPHPLRLRFDAAVEQFIARLKDDPEFRRRGEALREQLIAHPALADYVHGLWGQLLAWLQDDLDRPDSAIGQRIAVMAGAFGERLRNDAAMRRWIDEQIEAAAPRAIDRYRDDIRRYIVERVAEWNADEMTGELERNIGRDLQFIRINGTLVGGLVGLAIHALTQALR